MRKKIPDFIDSQTWTVESTLKERFRENIQVQSFDSEICLPPHDRELPPVTGLYREAKNCHFVISRPARANIAASFSTASTSNTVLASRNTTKLKTALFRCCAFSPTTRAIDGR
ncbi:hypothetical protein [Sulfuriflexus sp.]|uniref:hypothetical protein n=1 Tax=Sulfuriflexus sp. TaxID=2015443 RepID=UPI0028CD71A1|nr:hypothetical protein [Sulfuriflexus sp.]MDT8405172.1 hypothetical protein [Sulfuriflexus sp.]